MTQRPSTPFPSRIPVPDDDLDAFGPRPSDAPAPPAKGALKSLPADASNDDLHYEIVRFKGSLEEIFHSGTNRAVALAAYLAINPDDDDDIGGYSYVTENGTYSYAQTQRFECEAFLAGTEYLLTGGA